MVPLHSVGGNLMPWGESGKLTQLIGVSIDLQNWLCGCVWKWYIPRKSPFSRDGSPWNLGRPYPTNQFFGPSGWSPTAGIIKMAGFIWISWCENSQISCTVVGFWWNHQILVKDRNCILGINFFFALALEKNALPCLTKEYLGLKVGMEELMDLLQTFIRLMHYGSCSSLT